MDALTSLPSLSPAQRALGEPRGPLARDGYKFSREFAHARVSMDCASNATRIEWL